MTYDLSTAKILVVDDMKPMVGLTKSILNIFGFKNVYTAFDGKEAIEVTIQKDPDLIITDWVMEPMDGLELTKELRKNPLCPNPYVPVVMMTGFSSKLRVEKARDVGITEFLVKPFTSHDLYKRITQIIEKPRQFVDSGDFFGPDRRRRKSKNYQGPKKRDADDAIQNDQEADQNAVKLLRKLKDDAKNV